MRNQDSRIGQRLLQPSGYVATIPHPLPPRLTPDEIEALTPLLAQARTALNTFAANPAARRAARLDRTTEEQRVARAAQLLAAAARDGGWSVASLQKAHALLVRGGRGAERRPGRLRRAQAWIGESLDSAAYIPPPAASVRPLLEDLVTFLNTTREPAWYTAALAAGQLLLIHPFGDGNGRLARGVALALLLPTGVPPELPLDRYFHTHRDAQLRAARALSGNGAWGIWTAMFLEAVTTTARS